MEVKTPLNFLCWEIQLASRENLCRALAFSAAGIIFLRHWPCAISDKGDSKPKLSTSTTMASPDPPVVATSVESTKPPGVGIRRKGLKLLPRLPLSAFTPPNSGTSNHFPLPPSPSTVHPPSVVDSHVVLADGDLASWNTEVGQVLGGRIGGVVVQLAPSDSAQVQNGLERYVN
jgi:hypothetical protein